MSQCKHSASSFYIANFTVVPSQNRVLSNDTQLAVTPKMIAVLSVLAKRQGDTVSKDDIMTEVWGDVVVSDMVLSRAISDLRKVFGDSASKQIVIETVSKKGYRLKPTVTWENNAVSDRNDHGKNKHRKDDTKTKHRKTPENTTVLLGLLLTSFFMCIFYVAREYLPSETPKILTLKKNNISNDDAIERRVRFSPDGRYIVYDSNNRLKLRYLEENNPTELSETFEVSEQYRHITGVFSPDGKELAFRRFKEKTCEIYILNFIERSTEYLSSCSRVSSNGMDWSNDGNFIVTTELDLNKRIEYLVKIDLATGKRNTIAEPATSSTGYLFPRVSPNNKHVSVLHYRRFEDQWGVGTINLETGSYKEIASSYEKINQIVWADDSSLFYVIDGENGIDAGIWKIDIHDGKRQLILNADIRDMDYNRKTEQFIYTQNQKYSSVWIAKKVDGRHQSQELLDSAFQSTEPRLSPNEKYLAYISHRSGNGSLWIRDLATQKETQAYIAQQSELTDLHWSPNNDSLLFKSFTKQGNQINKLNIENQKTEILISSPSAIKARWGSSNTEIYIYEQRNKQWQITQYRDKNEENFMFLNKPIRHFHILNNQTVIYQPFVSNHIYIKDFSSNDRDGKVIIKNVLDWSVLDNNILISRWNRREKVLRFYSYSLNDESENLLSELELDAKADLLWQRPSLNITRDGRNIYFVKTKRTHSDIILVSQE